MTDGVLRLGVTGHQDLPDDVVPVLRERVLRVVTEASHVVAISSLARGTDQFVARTVLDNGGAVEVVVPCGHYDTLFDDVGRAGYDELVAASSSVARLPYPEPTEAAFLAAGLVVVERCELLLAVWDGEPARGLGGTADVVAYAGAIARPIERVWRTT